MLLCSQRRSCVYGTLLILRYPLSALVHRWCSGQKCRWLVASSRWSCLLPKTVFVVSPGFRNWRLQEKLVLCFRAGSWQFLAMLKKAWNDSSWESWCGPEVKKRRSQSCVYTFPGSNPYWTQWGLLLSRPALDCAINYAPGSPWFESFLCLRFNKGGLAKPASVFPSVIQA